MSGYYYSRGLSHGCVCIAQRPGTPAAEPAHAAFPGLTDFVAWWQRINCWPGMFPNPPQNAADGWLLANWSVYWVPPFVDAAFIPADVPDSRIACLTVLGSAAITACAADNQGSCNDFIATQNFIQPFPLILSFMMSEEVRSL